MPATSMSIIAPIPDPAGRKLNALQRRVDGEARSEFAAHLPIIEPFLARPSFLPLERHCWEACHNTSPFRVELGAPAVDAEGCLMFAEVTAGREGLEAIREALLTGRYAPPRTGATYEPRAIVARLAAGDVGAARQEAAHLDETAGFDVERVQLLARYPDGSWYERDFYTLDRAVAKA